MTPDNLDTQFLKTSDSDRTDWIPEIYKCAQDRPEEDRFTVRVIVGITVLEDADPLAWSKIRTWLSADDRGKSVVCAVAHSLGDDFIIGLEHVSDGHAMVDQVGGIIVEYGQ